ncbi:MAG TPA: hypothetical protein VHV82_05800 [Sporichthyaceae bacterium]|jgi:hypothetical protein|nr:hypothetical protein [Sporichthyaceae bacterium]
MPHDDFGSPDARLSADAVRLTDLALLAVQAHPFGELRAALQHAITSLEKLGPVGSAPAAVLMRRAEYLADAAALLQEALTRLGVALAAPAESDLSVHLARARDAVAYLAEIAADLLPDRLCVTIGTELAEGPARGRAVRVLERLREACELSELVVARAADALSELVPPPGYDAGSVPSPALLQERRAEIDRLISELIGAG